MGYVLDSNSIPSTTTGIDQRQQISPDMKFTCDGLITKWTVLAQYAVANSLTQNYKYGEKLTIVLSMRRLVECLLQSL